MKNKECMLFSLWTKEVEQETNELIALLHQWGITYLVGDDTELLSIEQHVTTLSAAISLIQRLARCEDARVKHACISLFLLHPELADVAFEIVRTSEVVIADQVAVFILATLYLQRFWSIRLALAFGHPSRFPETLFQHLWQVRHLPAPACHSGVQGLLALQQVEQQRMGFPVALIGDWQNQIQHLLFQEEAKQRPMQECIFPIFANDNQDGQYAVTKKECDAMSMRPTVDKAEIERFLRTFGQHYRKAGRLYIAGGAALVHAGIRSGRTQDIDVEVTDGDMLLTIDHLKNRLHLNIEIASPKDFIPVPSQWEAMSQYVGRYGNTEVFYFDFYSVALSKIDRGTTRDLQDVQLLVQQRAIDLSTLDVAFQDVMGQVQTPQGRMRYPRFDPTAFAARYQIIRQQLAQL